MFSYKNASNVTKTFYGVKFNPGEVHSVPGYINDVHFIRTENKVAPVLRAVKPTETVKKPAATSVKNTKKSQTSNESKEAKNNG